VPQPSANSAVPGDPAVPPADAVAPAIPPSSASAPGVIVPPAPGEAAQSAVPGTVDPTVGALPPEAGGVAPPGQNGNYRQRRSERQIQVREQVLRNLQNAN